MINTKITSKLLVATITILVFFYSNIYGSKSIEESKTWEEVFKKEHVVDYPIIFIHGIGGGYKDWHRAANIISSNNYFEMRFLEEGKVFHNYFGQKPTSSWVWNVSYYTIDPINEIISGELTKYSYRLKELLKKISLITGKEKFVLVAHSMGGLVARKYMTLDQKCWDSVHKIITVATPHNGVETSIGVVGQLRDLRPESKFLKSLNKNWAKYDKTHKKWGIVAGVMNKDLNKVKYFSTDNAGIGYITISSAIPFEEWRKAIKKPFGKPQYNTDNFGYRVLVNANHIELLRQPATLEAIYWGITK
jgi:hypothetical protein